MIIFANYSLYNATDVGVPYIQAALNQAISENSSALLRTYTLYTNAAYFSADTARYIDPAIGLSNIQYIVIAMPALAIISVPVQILILSSTGYKTKISGEILLCVILIGLLTLTIVSYAIGV